MEKNPGLQAELKRRHDEYFTKGLPAALARLHKAMLKQQGADDAGPPGGSPVGHGSGTGDGNFDLDEQSRILLTQIRIVDRLKPSMVAEIGRAAETGGSIDTACWAAASGMDMKPPSRGTCFATSWTRPLR